MSNKLHLMYKVFTSPKRLDTLLSFNEKGYLEQIGWFNAFDTRNPLDVDKKPIPWVTYAFIDFIKERLTKDLTIFEFGAGNSTHFYAKHAAKVVAVEHDKKWYERIITLKPDNSELIFCKLERGGDYCRMPVALGQKFDVIIIDGRDRVNCCCQCVDALSANGVIVLDNSERDLYKDGVEFLKHKGFKQLSFSGISPGSFSLKMTSVFYRSNNCLNI